MKGFIFVTVKTLECCSLDGLYNEVCGTFTRSQPLSLPEERLDWTERGGANTRRSLLSCLKPCLETERKRENSNIFPKYQ